MNFSFDSFKRKNLIWIVLLTILLSLFLETYIVLLENSSVFYLFSVFQAFENLPIYFSLKRFIVFFIILFCVLFILFNENLRFKFLNYIYIYRWWLGLLSIIVLVIFQIHGSSLALLNFSGQEHAPLLGINRAIKGDEFSVSTPFALSQYFNNFGYFTEILRATITDIFILYGQPVLDLAIIFRPFHLGYLFLSQGYGLSFYWVSRLIVLFLISFEFGMLITKKDKALSLVYTLLITFSPLVQWWFGVNFLVEMLIFAQLAILLVNHYMLNNKFLNRLICSLVMVVCVGGFIFALYPAWQIPLGWLFLGIFIWVVYKNKSKFNFSKKKDGFIIALFLILTILLVGYVLFKSQDAIISQLNTVYPGLRVFYGGVDNYWLSGDPYLLFDYMRNIFDPLLAEELGARISLAYIISFFPMGLLLYLYVTFVQKRRDLLLNILTVIYVVFLAYYLFTWPSFIADITMLGKSMTHRLLGIITFIGLLILIRSIVVMDKINFNFRKSKLLFSNFRLPLFKEFSRFSFILAFVLVVCVLLIAFMGMGSRFYTKPMLIIACILFTFSFFFILNIKNSKKAKTGFLICVIFISFSAGALVNPLESGVDYYFDQELIQKIESIVENDPNAVWVVEGHEIYINSILPVGAHTLNSVNTYPNYELWSKLDPNNEHEEVWNRYAHLKIVFQDQFPTVIETPTSLGNTSDHVVLTLNVDDMEKLNISYILSRAELEDLSNDNVTFSKIYSNNGFFIYNIKYNE